MTHGRTHQPDAAWLAAQIARLPSDEPVPPGTPGYNNYTTQKDHWLGWLDESSETGTYSRSGRADRPAKDVYNRIVEPKLLLWLITAAKVPSEQVLSAQTAAASAKTLAGMSAAIRKAVPWETVHRSLQQLQAPPIILSIQELFHGLIRARAREGSIRVPTCLPVLLPDDGDAAEPMWYPVDQMHGGFSYWIEGRTSSAYSLHVRSWCRIAEGSDQYHVISHREIRLVEEDVVSRDGTLTLAS